MTLKTYKSWNMEGRYVCRGEKATEFDAENNALFDIKQTRKKDGWIYKDLTYSQINKVNKSKSYSNQDHDRFLGDINLYDLGYD